MPQWHISVFIHASLHPGQCLFPVHATPSIKLVDNWVMLAALASASPPAGASRSITPAFPARWLLAVLAMLAPTTCVWPGWLSFRVEQQFNLMRFQGMCMLMLLSYCSAHSTHSHGDEAGITSCVWKNSWLFNPV